MANSETIKTAIDANVNTNGNQAITGAVMNSVLKQMVDSTDVQLTELESYVEIPAKYQSEQDGYIICSTGEFVSRPNANHAIFRIPNEGYNKILLKTTAYDAVPAVIAFYSSATISAANYISGVQARPGYHDYEASVPDNCKLIILYDRINLGAYGNIPAEYKLYGNIATPKNGDVTLTSAHLIKGKSITPTGYSTTADNVYSSAQYYECSRFANEGKIFFKTRGYESKLIKIAIALFDKGGKFLTRIGYVSSNKGFDISPYPNAYYFRFLIVYQTLDNVDIVTETYTDGDVIITHNKIVDTSVLAAIPTRKAPNSFQLPQVEDGVLDFGEDTLLVLSDGVVVLKNEVANFRNIPLFTSNTTSTAYKLVYNNVEKTFYCKRYDNALGSNEALIGSIRKVQDGYIEYDFPFVHTDNNLARDYSEVKISSNSKTRAYCLLGWYQDALIDVHFDSEKYKYSIQGTYEDLQYELPPYPCSYDTGWQHKSSIYDAQAQEGEIRWLRLCFARIDNGDLTDNDFIEINELLSCVVYSKQSRINLLLNTQVEKEIDIQRYKGTRIDLQEHEFSVKKILQMENSDFYFQGSAMYEKYFFQFHTGNSEIEMYDVLDKKFVHKFALEAKNNHAGSGAFGVERYDESDPFPLLYIGSMDEYKVYVYRIIKGETYDIELVQTITLPQGKDLMYIPNIAIDANRKELILFGYTQSSWANSSNNESVIARLNLPSLSDGNVAMSADDVIDKFNLPFIYAQQGGVALNGSLFLGYGNTATEGGLLWIDLIGKSIKNNIDLSFIGNIEPEGIGIYRGKLYMSFQKPYHSIYRFDFQ